MGELPLLAKKCGKTIPPPFSLLHLAELERQKKRLLEEELNAALRAAPKTMGELYKSLRAWGHAPEIRDVLDRLVEEGRVERVKRKYQWTGMEDDVPEK
ncbi:MAG: hypothetical protein U0641_05765 [Anaerolineae bacterium]